MTQSEVGLPTAPPPNSGPVHEPLVDLLGAGVPPQNVALAIAVEIAHRGKRRRDWIRIRVRSRAGSDGLRPPLQEPCRWRRCRSRSCRSPAYRSQSMCRCRRPVARPGRDSRRACGQRRRRRRVAPAAQGHRTGRCWIAGSAVDGHRYGERLCRVEARLAGVTVTVGVISVRRIRCR